MNRTTRTGALALMLAALLLALPGCSAIRKVTMPDEDNLLSGAGSIMVKKDGNAQDFETLDLDAMVSAYGLTPTAIVSAGTGITSADGALIFKYRRNDMQDRLIAASNQRCGTFIRTLLSSKSQTQMGWGGLQTFLSGAATITTPAAAARLLSAGSTISGSFLNQYNEAYFNNLTVTVISSGIAKKREGLLRDISAKRARPLEEYTVNGAIADALTYHAACNIVTGLEAAGSAINAADAGKVADKPPGATSPAVTATASVTAGTSTTPTVTATAATPAAPATPTATGTVTAAVTPATAPNGTPAAGSAAAAPAAAIPQAKPRTAAATQTVPTGAGTPAAPPGKGG